MLTLFVITLATFY